MLLTIILALTTLHTAQPIRGVVSVSDLKKETATQQEAKASSKRQKDVPNFPEGYQTKFQALTIKQMRIQQTLQGLEKAYTEQQAALQEVNRAGLALQKEMLSKMKEDGSLDGDVSEYAVSLTAEGVLTLTHTPPPRSKDIDKHEEKK